jgi:hypothetical protein
MIFYSACMIWSVVVMVVYLMSSFRRFLDKGVAEKWGRLRQHGLENKIQH